MLVETRGVAELSCFGLIPLKPRNKKTKQNNSLPRSHPVTTHKKKKYAVRTTDDSLIVTCLYYYGCWDPH